MSLRQHLLYRSDSVSICDVCCRPEFRQRGPEEQSSRHLVVFPRSGVFLKQVAGKEFVVDPSQVVFFNPDESYRCAHPLGSGDDCTAFEIQPEVLRDVIGTFAPAAGERHGKLFQFTHALCSQETFWFQGRMRHQLLSGIADSLMVDELSLGLITSVMRSAYQDRKIRPARRRRTTAQFHRELSERTRLFLAGRFSEDLNLHDVARAIHSSTFHLARIFHRETGLTLHQYRNQLRLRASLERLVEGHADLAALALDLGFSSHSHFCDTFRRAFGVAPSDFRRRANLKRLREMSKILEVSRPAMP